MVNYIGNRKFILCLIVIVASIVFLGLSKIDGQQFALIITVVFGTFGAANSIEHIAKGVGFAKK